MIKIQTRVKNLLGFQAQNENQNQNYKNKKIRLASDFLKASDNSREQGTSGKEGASHRFDVQQLSCRSLGCGPGRPSPPHSHRTFSVVTTGGWRAAGTRWAVGSKLLRPRMRRTAPCDRIPQPHMKRGWRLRNQAEKSSFEHTRIRGVLCTCTLPEESVDELWTTKRWKGKCGPEASSRPLHVFTCRVGLMCVCGGERMWEIIVCQCRMSS